MADFNWLFNEEANIREASIGESEGRPCIILKVGDDFNNFDIVLADYDLRRLLDVCERGY